MELIICMLAIAAMISLVLISLDRYIKGIKGRNYVKYVNETARRSLEQHIHSSDLVELAMLRIQDIALDIDMYDRDELMKYSGNVIISMQMSISYYKDCPR